MPSPMPCSRTMRRLLRLPRAAAANSADVLDGVLGGFAIAVRFRNQTTNKFSADQFDTDSTPSRRRPGSGSFAPKALPRLWTTRERSLGTPARRRYADTRPDCGTRLAFAQLTM